MYTPNHTHSGLPVFFSQADVSLLQTKSIFTCFKGSVGSLNKKNNFYRKNLEAV